MHCLICLKCQRWLFNVPIHMGDFLLSYSALVFCFIFEICFVCYSFSLRRIQFLFLCVFVSTKIVLCSMMCMSVFTRLCSNESSLVQIRAQANAETYPMTFKRKKEEKKRKWCCRNREKNDGNGRMQKLKEINWNRRHTHRATYGIGEKNNRRRGDQPQVSNNELNGKKAK